MMEHAGLCSLAIDLSIHALAAAEPAKLVVRRAGVVTVDARRPRHFDAAALQCLGFEAPSHRHSLVSGMQGGGMVLFQ